MRASCRGWSSFRPGIRLPLGRSVGWVSSKFLAIHKGFQDILLHLQIAVDDAIKPLPQLRKILHGLADGVIGVDIVGRCFGAKEETIADVLLEEALPVVTADHGIRQVEILDHGLELAAMMTGDAAAEDQGEFVGLTDGAIGIDESLLEGINGGTTTKDEIVGELHLGKKQPVLNTGLLSLLGSEKGCEAGQPFVGAGDQILGGEGIGEFLQSLRVRTLHKSVRALLKVGIALSQAQGQPVMLIETDASREGEVRADSYEHLPPPRVVNIEVVLFDPPPFHLQMPAVVFSDSGHDGGGLARFDDGHDLVGLRTPEVALHEVIAPARWIFVNGYTPFLGAVLGPVVVLRSDVV